MARNDIQFGQAKQADFSQANTMFALAQHNMQQALKTGQDTLSDFNKAVTEANDAKIKQFINSFSKEELEQNRGTITDFINDISQRSGGMYSKGTIEDYHDKRMLDLLDRDNQKMLNEEKAQLYQDKLNDREVDKLISPLVANIHVNPNDESIPNSIMETFNTLKNQGYSDEQLQKIVPKAYDAWGKALDNLTAVNKSQQNLGNTIYSKYDPYFADIARKEVKSRYLEGLTRANPHWFSSVQEQQNALTNLKQSRDKGKQELAQLIEQMPKITNSQSPMLRFLEQVNKLTESPLKDANALNSWFNGGRESALKNAQTQATTTLTELKNQEILNQLTNPNYQRGQQLEALRNSPQYKQLEHVGLGNTLEVDNNGQFHVNASKLLTSMYNQIASLRDNNIAEKNSISFAEWQSSPEGEATKKKILSDGFWLNRFFGVNMRYDDLVRAFPKDTTEYEKVHILNLLAQDNSPYARYFLTGDSPSESIDRVLQDFRLSQGSVQHAKSISKFNELVTSVAETQGVPREAVMGALYQTLMNGSTNVPQQEWLVNLLTGKGSYSINQSSPKGTNSNTNINNNPVNPVNKGYTQATPKQKETEQDRRKMQQLMSEYSLAS